MNWAEHTKSRWRSALLGGAITALLGWLLILTRLGDPVAQLSIDLPFLLKWNNPTVSEVSILNMDDVSHRILDQPTLNKWDRSVHARLIERLMLYRPRAIIFDVYFAGQTANDHHLFEAIAAATNAGIPIVLAGRVEKIPGGVMGTRILEPFPELEEPLRQGFSVADKLMWGVQAMDGDDVRWRVLHDQRRESVPELVVRLTGGKLAPNSEAYRWLNYYGPPGSIPSFSYSQVFDSKDVIPTFALSNKVIFIGADVREPWPGGTGPGTDHYDTPWSWWTKERTSGVELTATAYLNLVRVDWMTRMNPWLEAMFVLALGAILGFGLSLCRAQVAALIGIGTAFALGILACALAWQAQVWFAWLVIAGTQVPVALGWSVLVNTRRLAAEKEQLQLRLAEAETTMILAPDARPEPGPLPTVPDHAILRKIGEGGYGEVWLARNVIGTHHAVKIVYRSAFSSSAPFEREFNGIQKFTPISRSHPGFVNILHVGRNEKENYFYSIMELADDEERGQTIIPESYTPRTLANLIRSRRKLSVGECMEIGLQLSSALEFLHARNLIHRDIKPSNIIFVNGVAKFADVGLVTDIADTDGKVTYLGTEGYIAPEGPGTATADLFGLGKVLYEASTGKDRLQFPDLPTSLFEAPDRTASEFNAIIVKACEFNVTARLQSASELHRQLLALKQRQ